MWELTIKIAAGRLRLAGPLADFVVGSRGALQSIDLARIEATGRLPFHHGDPFDRMLVAQAIEEGLTLVTADRALRRHPLAWLW